MQSPKAPVRSLVHLLTCSRIPTPKTITKPHPLQQRTTPRKLPRAGAKRLRSVSLEKLPANPSQPKKDLVVVASSSGEEEGGEEFQSPLPASSSDDVETDETQDEGMDLAGRFVHIALEQKFYRIHVR